MAGALTTFVLAAQDSDDVAIAAIGGADGGPAAAAAGPASPDAGGFAMAARTPGINEDFLKGMQQGMELSYPEFIQALSVRQ